MDSTNQPANVDHDHNKPIRRIDIRPFRAQDQEKVQNLFFEGIGGAKAFSARSAALRGCWMRPRSIIAYLAIATASIVGTRWAGPLRWAALATAVLSATYLIKNRQVLARLYLQHATPRAGSDLSNIARHYGVVMVDGGESKFLGRSGFWVAEMMEDETPTGEVVGCIGIDSNFYPEPAVAELRRAAVSATTVRQGIGRRLIETALDHCRKHDFKTVRLSTSMYQTSAVKIYEKYGWRYVGPYHFPGMVWWADVHLGSFVLEL